jgi:hypothetical protein
MQNTLVSYSSMLLKRVKGGIKPKSFDALVIFQLGRRIIPVPLVTPRSIIVVSIFTSPVNSSETFMTSSRPTFLFSTADLARVSAQVPALDEPSRTTRTRQPTHSRYPSAKP